MDHQVVCEPTWSWESRVPNQAVQLLAIHAPQGVQGELCGHCPAVHRTIDGLTVQCGVPREAGTRVCYRATGGHLLVRLSLHHNHGIQRGNGSDWE